MTTLRIFFIVQTGGYLLVFNYHKKKLIKLGFFALCILGFSKPMVTLKMTSHDMRHNSYQHLLYILI